MPKFIHDCDHCEFIESLMIENTMYNVYMHQHRSPEDRTYIFRASNEDSDYCSYRTTDGLRLFASDAKGTRYFRARIAYILHMEATR